MDAKIFIAVSSLAVTIGLWNVLSNRAFTDQKPVQAAAGTSPVTASVEEDLPPIPTLVPLADSAGFQPQANTAAQASQNPGGLRSVTAPNEQIVQKNKIVVDIQSPASSSGGSRSSSGPAPVTKTRAS